MGKHKKSTSAKTKKSTSAKAAPPAAVIEAAIQEGLPVAPAQGKKTIADFHDYVALHGQPRVKLIDDDQRVAWLENQLGIL